jgi:AhpD family alkylhydroperoxidase
MYHDPSAFYEAWPTTMNAMKATPGGGEIGKAFAPFFQAIMKDSTAEGGLSAKQKELIALGIGVTSRCEACIYAHVEKCLKAGASPREIMDASGVAVMMGGGPVYTYTTVVSSALIHWEAQRSGA